MSAAVPKPFLLRTPRLELREFTTSDTAALHAVLSCPQVMKFSGTGPLTTAQSRLRLLEFIRSYSTFGFGKWAVTRADSGDLIGYCGVELTTVANGPVRELGFRYRPEFWGKGYASEAGTAVLNHCFQVLGWSELSAFVDPENVRSVRTLEKLGFRLEGKTKWQHLSVHLYRISRR